MNAVPTAQEFTDLLDEMISMLHRKAREHSGEIARRFADQREAVENAEDLWDGYSRQQPERWLAADTLTDAYKRLERVIRRNLHQSEDGEREGYALVLDRLTKITA